MKASELILELQNCIDKYGDLVVKYDGSIEVSGAGVCNEDWTEEDQSLPPDRILVNQLECYYCKK